MRLLLIGALLLTIGVPGSTATAALVAKSRTLVLSGKAGDISADGRRVAVRQEAETGNRICAQVLAWTPTRRSLVRLPRRCTGSRATEYTALTLAGSRLLWTNYTYGNHAYCEGPYTALLPRPRPKRFGLCTGEPDIYVETAGDGSLAVVSRYDYCDEAQCYFYDESGDIHYLPAGPYRVRIYRVSRGRLVAILPPVDFRRLIGADGGRILVEEPKPRRIVVYNSAGTEVASVPLRGGKTTQAVLTSGFLAVKNGSDLSVYDARTGALERSYPIAAKAKLRDAHAGKALYTVAGKIRVLRLSDGRHTTVRAVRGLVDAELETPGLYYAYNVAGRGRVVFQRLLR